MSELAVFGVEAGFVVPTTTGLAKGILDAHASLRVFLKVQEIHDFQRQLQGPEYKAVVEGRIVTADGAVPTKVSFYRPSTKQGDPRLWIYGLPGYAEPGNLLAILPAGDTVYIANFSDARVLNSLQDSGSPLRRVIEGKRGDALAVARELLNKISVIADQGYVPSLRQGPTGVGFTLETMLGIAANARQAPDYKGIELKAQRRAPSQERARTRVTLFSKTPDWKHSACRNGQEILAKHGYPGRVGAELYVTVSARPNPQGLQLWLDDAGLVHCRVVAESRSERVIQWDLETLEAKLRDKHQSTFWVTADTILRDGTEYFHFRQVVHSQGPLTANFGPLITDGTVTMDLTLSTRTTGATRDHGYLFKIWPESRHLLIPNAETHVLAPAQVV